MSGLSTSRESAKFGTIIVDITMMPNDDRFMAEPADGLF
jgi:hypothetical protein